MTKINTEVTVSAYYFAGRTMRAFPRAIEYQGRAVTFVEGLRYLVGQGQASTQLYDMQADDASTYRLQQSGHTWTLLGTRGAY